MAFQAWVRNVVVMLVFLAGISAGVGAFTITSITTSSPVTVATVGTIVTIQSSITGDSTGVATQATLSGTGTTGSDLKVTDPAAGFYSNVALSSTPLTLSYSVQAPTADTYTYSVEGVYSGGSQSSTVSTLQFVSPSVFEVSGSVSNSSNWVGQTFTVSVRVNNPTVKTISTSFALNLNPAAFTVVSGDPTSGTTTINAGQSTTFNYVVKATGATVNSPVSFSLGDSSNAFSSLVTNMAIPTPASQTVPASGGSSSTAVPSAVATASASSEQPVVIPPANSQAPQAAPQQSTSQITPSSSVSGSFTDTSATMTFTATAGPSGATSVTEEFGGTDLHCADVTDGTVTISPVISSCQDGSIIATWNVNLAPQQTFTATVNVAKKLDQSVLSTFKAPKLASAPNTNTGSGSASTPTQPTAPATVAPNPTSASADYTLLYALGALVILGVLYYFTMMRRK